MQLDLSGLTDHAVHVSECGGQDLGVLEFDAMSPADAKFGYCRFAGMSQANVPVVLLEPNINGTASLPNVNLTTFAKYAVCTSETSVNFNVTTRCYIPEDSKLQTSKRLYCLKLNSILLCCE
jgi:hypothetical protein